MLATIHSAALRGLDVVPVEVEVSISRGTPMIQMVGLAESAVREGRERIRAAAREAGHPVPGLRVTVNLAPADVPKHGSAFDLPITAGILAAREEVRPDRAAAYAMLGELGLDGSLRPVRGVLPAALSLGRRRRARGGEPEGLIVPRPNLAEAGAARGLDVRGAGTLRQVIRFLEGDGWLPGPDDVAPLPAPPARERDLADVRGHEGAKRAMEVSAAGGHHLLLRGSPGGGKTMLARRFATLLPDLSEPDAIEATGVHSVAGVLAAGSGLIRRPPFRSPHHTVTRAGLAGGGSVPRPGEVSLAHRGVLFLDELPEFRRSVLEVLRQPMEEGRISLVRSGFSAEYPARFTLVAAMNPCPCGYAGAGGERCTCDPGDVRRYRARISGPFMDRLDLRVDVTSPDWRELRHAPTGEPSDRLRERVAEVRDRTARRLREATDDGAPGTNAEIGPKLLRRLCPLEPAAETMLERAVGRFGLSARGCHRVLRVARTVADLAGEGRIGPAHVAEALRYRG